MPGVRSSITPVSEAELPLLDAALRALAADLADVYSTQEDTLAKAVCGPDASCIALLAKRAEQAVGVVLAAPIFSTIHGGAGLYVSDLWVAPQARGEGLSRQLLAALLQEGARRSMGRFLKLAVYHNNPNARAAYERMGFTPHTGETSMLLSGPRLFKLKETP